MARFTTMTDSGGGVMYGQSKDGSTGPAHPDFAHLVLLVFEAVLEVVCVSLPGYIVASQGMFDADAQKFLANLNVMLFTPCLIFTKLASQLTPDKLPELAIIPVIFLLQIVVSYSCSMAVSKLFGFQKRAQNFVVAMGVFGNSNSLPISLVLSLSKTISGLHWDKIDGDNDDEVAARGILYLMIFQQLGQLLRWSWGYHVLLAPADRFSLEEGGSANGHLEGGIRFADDASGNPSERRCLLADVSSSSDDESDVNATPNRKSRSPPSTPRFTSGAVTPLNQQPYAASSPSSSSSSLDRLTRNGHATTSPKVRIRSPPRNGRLGNTRSAFDDDTEPLPTFKTTNKLWKRSRRWWTSTTTTTTTTTNEGLSDRVISTCEKLFSSLPEICQSFLKVFYTCLIKLFRGVWEFMNPPLWAMLAALVVASVPKLQRLFFSHGTFINNSVTRAVAQSGGVAVPLILVVLGANLARNTIPQENRIENEDPKLERKLLIASLLSRMLLPTIVMAPILALMAKYLSISILDDPIFVVVAFLLAGAPSALQLAQICQINNVYVGTMTRLLFQSYVIWILPSTLTLVILALEVVQWAT